MLLEAETLEVLRHLAIRYRATAFIFGVESEDHSLAR